MGNIIASLCSSPNPSAGPALRRDDPSAGRSYANPVFGAELHEVLAREGGSIPWVLAHAMEIISENYLATQGLFRVPGSLKVIREVVDQVNRGDQVDLFEYDVRVVAAVMKMYCRDLPQSLVPFEMYDEVLSVVETFKDMPRHRLAGLRTAVLEIPEESREVLEAVVRFLVEVCRNHPDNLMTALNISIVWAPNILRSRPDPTMDLDPVRMMLSVSRAKLAFAALHDMLVFTDYIFGRSPTPVPAENLDKKPVGPFPDDEPPLTPTSGSPSAVDYSGEGESHPHLVGLSPPPPLSPREDQRYGGPDPCSSPEYSRSESQTRLAGDNIHSDSSSSWESN